MEAIMDINNKETVRAMLSESGYSDTAIDYYIDQPDMGSLEDADQVSELTGQCGDTMKIYLKMDGEIIKDAKIQVLGCPGAIASAMVAMEMIKGMTIEEARKITDRDIFRRLIEIPDQKQHCIRLSVKTMNQAFDEISPPKA